MNTGDGIRMAMEVGADLWNMNLYQTVGTMGGLSFIPTEGNRALLLYGPSYSTGSVMLVAGDGSRYLKEDGEERHGHLKFGDVWKIQDRPQKSFLVYDEAMVDKIYIFDQEDQLVKADTLDKLAEATGMEPEVLNKTVKNFNFFVESGEDYQFGRDISTMTAFSAEGPYYAIPVVPCMVNTQGGPRRSEKAEVMGLDGKPIPHLYCAGEMGNICPAQYQGGGNVAETFIFGDIAGKNAAAEKEPMPAYDVREKVESNLVYTPGKVNDYRVEKDNIELEENEYLGYSDKGMGGMMTVKVTMDGDKIAAVEVLEHHETKGYGDRAVAALPGMIVEANSTDVDNITGASLTIRAIKEAVAQAK